MKKILFFVLWFGFVFASCKNTQEHRNELPEVKTHKVSFAVEDSKTGTLTAQIKGGHKLTTSPSMVENGKTIIFTASPNKDYIVESWFKGTNDVTAQATDDGKKYELTITEAVEVKVKFKKATAPNPKKVKVSFSVDGGNGQLKAKIEGDSTEHTNGTTGIDVEKDKRVTFTATPDKDYIVESWFKGTTDVTIQATDDGKKYELTITEAVEVKVKFKKATAPSPQTHNLIFEVDGDGGTLKAEYYDDGVAIPTSPATIEHGKAVMFTAESNDGYEIEKWTHNGNVVNGERQGYDAVIDKDTVIKVKFRKKAPTPVETRKVKFGVVDNKGGSLKAKVEGETTEYTDGTTGFDVEKGKKVIFTATPESNYEVEEWTSNGRLVPNKKDNEYRLHIGNNVTVLVKFKAKTPPAQTEDFVLINIPNEIKGIKPAQNLGMRYKGIFIEGRRIKLSPYKMAKHEVTYKLWKEVKEWAVEKGYKFVNEGQKGDNGNFQESSYDATLHTDDNEPVAKISWRDAIIWCNAYTEKILGEEFCVYRSHEDNNVILKDASDADHCNQVYFDKTKKGFRLPTEAEWEAAARYQGDGTSEDHKINAAEYGSGVWLTNLDSASGAKANHTTDPSEVKAVAWFNDNAENKTHPVGQLRANSLGLYDMSGNVVELCFDWHDSKLKASGELEEDPTGLNATKFDETFKVARGSPYVGFAKDTIVGNLNFKYKSNFAMKFCGFRLARYAD